MTDRPTIALIDDDEMIRSSLAMLLEDHGFQVLAGDHPDQVAHPRLSLVIADYQLPGGMTGFDALSILKARLCQPLACLILSGDTSPALAERCRSLGLALLVKPVTADKLLDAIRHLI